MEGKHCPRCGATSEWLDTANEWEFYCRPCDVRFNKEGEILDTEIVG